MKICIFSDIHGNNYSFSIFVNEVVNKYDYYLFAGDIYGYYYGIDEVLELLNKLEPLKTVIGNHDVNYIKTNDKRFINKHVEKYGKSYEIKSDNLLNYIRNESDIIEMNIDDIKLAMVHGTLNDHTNGRDYPDKDYEYCNLYSNYDVVIHGHTHYKMLKKYKGTLIINPGSIGQSRNEDGTTYAVLDTNLRSVEFKKVRWNKELLYKEINEREPKNTKLIEVLEREIK